MSKKVLHLLFANDATKPFEIMLMVYLKGHRMQVDSYICQSAISLNLQVFPQSPSLRFFIERAIKAEIAIKNLRQLTPIFLLLQLMAMENYLEKCSQIPMLLKDISKARRKLNILCNSCWRIFYAIPPR